MANRVEIPIVVLEDASPTSPVSGATAIIKNRIDDSSATVFANSGADNTAISQPLSTDSAGRLTGWLSRGAYKALITIPGKSVYEENFDIAPGSDGEVAGSWIADNAITTPKIADNAVTSAKIADNAVTSTEIAANAVGTSEIADKSVTIEKLASSSSGFKWYTPKYISTEESTASVTPVLMATPDEVSDVTMPTNGLIVVAYRARAKASLSKGWATLYLNSTSVKDEISDEFIEDQIASTSYHILNTNSNSLIYHNTEETGTVTTGQIVEGALYIFADAGVYDVSVRWSAETGTVTRRDSKLWVWTLG